MKYLGKVSIAEDGEIIINPVNPDVVVGPGDKVVIYERDGDLIAAIPEDNNVPQEGVREAIQMLEEVIEGMDDAYGTSQSCYIGTYWRDNAREKIRETQTALENMKEKTCTLIWRSDGVNLADCLNCGEGQLYDDYNYCPNCGAKNLNLARTIPIRHLKPSVEDVSDLLINVDEMFNPQWVSEEPNRPVDSIEDPNDPGSWINPDRGKKFPVGEHDPGLFAWECPECKAYGDSIEGPRTMVCPECGSDILPVEVAEKNPGEKCKCYKGSLLGPGWPECPYCGGELPGDFIPDGAVYADTDSILMLFCKKCNKIVVDPIWDEETHGPYCPKCKTTLVERTSDKEAGSK